MENDETKRPRGRPRSAHTSGQTETVQALDRGLQVLKELARLGSSTLADLSVAAKLPASTTHRILGTLQHHGFVQFNQNTQQWAIGIEAFRIGSAYLVRSNLVEAAIETMRVLRGQSEPLEWMSQYSYDQRARKLAYSAWNA